MTTVIKVYDQESGRLMAEQVKFKAPKAPVLTRYDLLFGCVAALVVFHRFVMG